MSDAEKSQAEQQPDTGQDHAQARGDADAGSRLTDDELRENRKARRKKRREERLGKNDTPKDRNERVRAKVMRKSEAEAEPQGLTVGEMIDDAFARAVHKTVKWAKAHWTLLQGALFALVVGGAGYLAYVSWQQRQAEDATSALMAAVLADRAQIDPAGKRANDEGPDPVFRSRDELSKVAESAYERVPKGNTAAAVLAKLGKAGALLDQRKFAEAEALYREVRASALATHDVDVRCRALEGLGFSLEGKGDADGAMRAFKELEAAGPPGLSELGVYHQARLLAAKGDIEGTKALIKKARESLLKLEAKAGTAYLNDALGDLERKVDPKAAPPPLFGAGSPQMTLEQIEQLRKKLEEIQGN